MERRNAWLSYTEAEEKELEQVAKAYRNFLNVGKTERECVTQIIREARAAGYESLEEKTAKGEKLKAGDKVYTVGMKKIIALFHIGQDDISEGMNILGAHIDSPRLDVKQNPLRFQMPAGEKGVTIEAMTKDASIEDGSSGILGTVMVIGAAAVLTWQGCRIGTELYLKRILPDGAAIPANATELAELVWDDAGKPAPAAALDTDATDAQKALTWASENQLLPSNKTADASVSYWEVIQIWRKAQTLKN